MSVTLVNVRVCTPDFAMKALEQRNDFDRLDRGRFVLVHCTRVHLSQTVHIWRHYKMPKSKNGKI